MNLIFDLDLTLINSSIAEPFRKKRDWQKVYTQIPTFTEYEGMKDVIAYLAAQKIPYSIVTSSPEPYCKKVCAHWNFSQTYLVTFYDTKNRKPHPDPILLAMSRMRAEGSDTLSFGDRDIDIQASHAAGVKSVACLWGCLDHESLLSANPTYVIHHPHEIIPLIGKVFS